MGETVVALVHPDDRTALAAAEDDARAVRHAVQLEHRVRRRDGGWLWVEARIVGDRDRAGRLTGLRIAWRDVEERRRRDAELRHQATHDPLTGLWNRGRFREELDRCVAEARRYGQPTALMLLDLDGFKAVNDRFGHDAGDRHLEAVAQSIRAAVRASDHCARVGGDEFAVLLPHATFDEARVAAERIVAGVAALGLTRASIGVAIVGASGDGAAWLRRADDAMYVAKRAGGDRVAHAP